MSYCDPATTTRLICAPRTCAQVNTFLQILFVIRTYRASHATSQCAGTPIPIGRHVGIILGMLLMSSM